MNDKTKGMICAFLGGSLWGFSGTCGQFLFQNKGMDSSTLVAMRMCGAAFVLLLVTGMKEKKNIFTIFKNKKDTILLIIFGLFGLLACQYTYLTAIFYSNSGTATVLQYLGVIVILIITCIMTRKLPSHKELLCVLLAMSGTFLIATHGSFDSLSLSKEGLFWGLVSALAMASYTMLPKKIIAKYGSSIVTMYGMLIGGVTLSVFVKPWSASYTVDTGFILALSAIIILGTALAFSLYLNATGLIGAVNTSMIACVEPVSAMLCSFFWLHTAFSLFDIIGGACIMLAVILLSLK